MIFLEIFGCIALYIVIAAAISVILDKTRFIEDEVAAVIIATLFPILTVIILWRFTVGSINWILTPKPKVEKPEPKIIAGYRSYKIEDKQIF